MSNTTHTQNHSHTNAPRFLPADAMQALTDAAPQDAQEEGSEIDASEAIEEIAVLSSN